MYYTFHSKVVSIIINVSVNVRFNVMQRTTRNGPLQRPSVCSCLKLTDRSVKHHAPVLWNSLSMQLRQPMPHHPSINQTGSTLAPSSSSFHAKLKTFLFIRAFSLSLLHYPLMSVLLFIDPAKFFISYPFSLLSFTVTLFITSV